MRALVWCGLVLGCHPAFGARCDAQLTVDRAFLYRVEGEGRTSHIFGSRHFGVPLAAVPGPVHELIEVAETFVFETRGRPASAPDPVRPLSASLSLDAWTELVDRLVAKGVPAGRIDDLSPALAYFLLSVEPEAMSAGRLDAEIRDFAVRRGAKIKALESTADQDRLLAELVDARDLESALLRTPERPAPDLAYYLRGDARAGEDVLETLRREHPSVYARLVVRRNHAWIPKILGAHRRRGRTLVVVGALHLGGADGLLRLLSERSYTVRRER